MTNNTAPPVPSSISNPEQYLKNILSKLMNDFVDQFEVMELARKFSVDLSNEESFSKQKYLLQKSVLEQILKSETENDRYFTRLLEETRRNLNFSKTRNYLCCLVGCLFATEKHRSYIHHLKSVHHTYDRLECNFMHQCRRQFPTVHLLLGHIGECHSGRSQGEAEGGGEQIEEDVPCKCDLLSCGGKKFRNIFLLMTHISTFHSEENRICIFDQCSTKFKKGYQTSRHFRIKHKLTNRLTLKAKHLLEETNELAIVNDETDEPENNRVPDIVEHDEYYNDNDWPLLDVEANRGSAVDEVEECDKNYFLMQYADFLNRLCQFHFIPQRTVTKIADEYRQNSLKSRDLRENKLRISLKQVPNITEEQIDKIVSDSIYDDEYMKAQNELTSEFKRNKFIAANFEYVPPVELLLNKEEVKAGASKDVFHYIPVKESFKHLIEDKSLVDVLVREREKEKRDKNVLQDLRDGTAFQTNPFFQKNPGAFAAHFYSDAVELTNPLGAAKGRHKIVQVFYTICQIPKSQRSQIDRMQLCMVFKNSLIKKYGYDAIYKCLVQDLKDLEVGITINYPVERQVQLGLLAYSGDNLEAHCIAGFSACFSSKDICRFCHCMHSDLLENIHDYDGDNMHT